MDHKTETFRFKDVRGKDVEIQSKPYTFKLEEVLTKRFGVDKMLQINDTGKLNHTVNLSDVVEDFPKLLILGKTKINWADQEYDELQRVYYFFLEYKRNASLRHFTRESEILRSNIAELKNMLLSTSGSIFQELNKKHTESTS